MKKILLNSLLLTISFFSTTFSYDLTDKDKEIIDKKTKDIRSIIDNKWENIAYKYIFAINSSIKKLDKESSKAVILSKIQENITSYLKEKNKKIENTNNIEYYSDFWIDINKVREKWLWYYNKVRTNLWRNSYSYEEKLNKTAKEWSDTSLEKWVMSHKRNENDSYYDYNKINSWFKERWVVCENINRVTFTENIWKWYYTCKKWLVCTDELINWTKEIFDMYMSEKNQKYKAHYESIVRKEFNKIWLWISIKKLNENDYEFYITTHFCTKIKD